MSKAQLVLATGTVIVLGTGSCSYPIKVVVDDHC